MIFFFLFDYEYIKEESERSVGWIVVIVGDIIYIIEENFMVDFDMVRRMIVYESVYVFQKQWFNVKYGVDIFDGIFVIQVLIEGDVDLVVDIYCERNGILIYKICLLSGDLLMDIYIFFYVFGDFFVRYFYEKGNWMFVNWVYECYLEIIFQVMVLEYYFENRKLKNVMVEVLENWSIFRNDRMGVFYFYVFMRDVVKFDNDMVWNVLMSWMGDRLILVNNGIDYVIFWKVEFEDEKVVEFFVEILEKFVDGNIYVIFEIIWDDNVVILKVVRRVRVEV